MTKLVTLWIVFVFCLLLSILFWKSKDKMGLICCGMSICNTMNVAVKLLACYML